MRKFSLLLFLLVFATALLLIFVGTSVFSKQSNSRLMFQHLVGGKSEIYAVGIKDHALRRTYVIDDIKSSSSVLLVSPSGRYLAFMRTYTKLGLDNKLSIIDLDNGELVSLPLKVEPYRNYVGDSIVPIEWSPLSEKVALIAEGQDGASDIYVYDVKSKSLINLTQNPLGENSLAWSSDGKTLAFITFAPYLSENDKAKGSNRAGQPSKIVIVNPDQINKRIVIDLSFDAQFAKMTENSTLPCNLMWSPTGKYIALQIGCAEGAIATDILIADTQQGNLINLTNSLISNIPYYATHSIRWAASKDLLAIGSYKQRIWLEVVPENTPTQTVRELIVFDPNLMASAKMDINNIPSNLIWSDQEKYLAWEEVESNKINRIFLGQYSQGKIISLKPDGIIGCNPKFSPDGNYLAFEYPLDGNKCESLKEERFDVKIVSLTTGDIVNLTDALVGRNTILGWIR